MRWVKHLTTARNDEKMALVLDSLGPEGYGVYWLIIEIIGEKVSGADTKITYPERFFRKSLGVSGQKLRVFLDFFKDLELFSVEKSQNTISIDCPNILKYRDEYTVKRDRNSGHCPDTVRTMSASDTDTDTETEAETEEESFALSSSVEDSEPPQGVNACARAEWAESGSDQPQPGDETEPGSDQSRQKTLGKPPKAQPRESPADYHERYLTWARAEIERVKTARWPDWQLAYPAVDLDRECAAAFAWLAGNPSKRKGQLSAFLTKWLKRSQERGHWHPARGQPLSHRTVDKQQVTVNAVNSLLNGKKQ